MPPERARPKAVRPGRHRVCVSLNVDIAEKLDLLARAHDCWKVEIVIRAAYACDPARLTDAAVSRFRARRGATITPYVMDLTPDELNRIDELAAATKLNRSAFVRRLIEAQDEPPPTTGTGVGPNDIDPSNIDRDI